MTLLLQALKMLFQRVSFQKISVARAFICQVFIRVAGALRVVFSKGFGFISLKNSLQNTCALLPIEAKGSGCPAISDPWKKKFFKVYAFFICLMGPASGALPPVSYYNVSVALHPDPLQRSGEPLPPEEYEARLNFIAHVPDSSREGFTAFKIEFSHVPVCLGGNFGKENPGDYSISFYGMLKALSKRFKSACETRVFDPFIQERALYLKEELEIFIDNLRGLEKYDEDIGHKISELEKSAGEIICPWRYGQKVEKGLASFMNLEACPLRGAIEREMIPLKTEAARLCLYSAEIEERMALAGEKIEQAVRHLFFEGLFSEKILWRLVENALSCFNRLQTPLKDLTRLKEVQHEVFFCAGAHCIALEALRQKEKLGKMRRYKLAPLDMGDRLDEAEIQDLASFFEEDFGVLFEPENARRIEYEGFKATLPKKLYTHQYYL